MQDLQLIGVHEDGEHLLLGGADSARFRMRVDEPLRAAIRRDRPRLGQLQIEIDGGLRPRDVQALIRAGASAEEAASRAGWSVEKVHRYEGPILAEREHVTGLARAARLRGPNSASSSGNAATLSARVAERLKGRGVDATEAGWDSWRAEDGPWTVVLTFAAGGRQRQASWSFDLANRTVSAVDDEARWLSEAEQLAKGPLPAPHLSSPTMRALHAHDPNVADTKVYDVEAEGGLRAAPFVEHHDEPLDLMTAMRERSTARGRRRSGGRRGSPKAPTNVPGAGDHAPDQALPLDDLSYDPETMPPPPPAHADPDPAGVDGRPEPEAAAYLIEVADQDSSFEHPPGSEATDGAATQPSPRKAARKTGRPSVPAWGDIMFGSRPGADRSSS